MKAKELEEYSAKELDRLSREREEAIKAKGGLPYLGSLAVGESRILLMPKVPLDNPDKDGRPRKGLMISEAASSGGRFYALQGQRSEPRLQFVVKKPNDEQEYAWTVNIKSPLYRDLLGFLPNEITGKFPSEISGKRVPSCSASYGPAKGGLTRATRSRRLRVVPEIHEPGNRKNITGFDPYFSREQK